jgi:hypothetical protein
LPLINNKEALKSDPTLVETARRQTVQGKSPLPQEHGEQRERRKLVAHLIKKSTRPFRRAWTRLKRKLVRLGARSRLAATLYYALFDRSFDREHQATLAPAAWRLRLRGGVARRPQACFAAISIAWKMGC